MGLLHSCFLLGHTHPPHVELIFTQLIYCTVSPHNCLRVRRQNHAAVEGGESNLDWDELLGNHGVASATSCLNPGNVELHLGGSSKPQ